MRQLHHRAAGRLPIAELEPLPRGERTILREVRRGDVPALRRYAERNTGRFTGFDAPPGDPITMQAWVDLRVAQGKNGSARAYVAFLRNAPAQTIGVVCFDSISTGCDSSAIVSFSIDRDCEGWGLAHEMVSTACARAFAAFDLHTLNAYHYVENHRSAALLRRVGFHIRAAMDSVPPDLAAFLRPQVHLTLDRPD